MARDSSPTTVLVVAEDPALNERISTRLRENGIDASCTSSVARALELLEARSFDLIIAEASRSLGTGGLLTMGHALLGELPIVVVSPDAAVEEAVQALKEGAADFVSDLAPENLLLAVKKALASVARLPDHPTRLDFADALVGDSPPMRHMLETMRRSSGTTATVLIRGETGTGKEVVARALHRMSGRKDRPFIKVHCAALPDALLESELFGHERGAFTGAVARKPGRIELAQGGTLFLDEIGDMTPAVQVKLLRVLQDREFERLGGTETLRTDARFCAATHRDLEGMIERGEFREDLFYRLNVVPIWVPPLRGRRADIDALARVFCARFAAAHGKRDMVLDDEAVRVLRRERWPGNARQLQNFVERLVVLSPGAVIGVHDVTRELTRQVHFVTQAPSSIATARATPPAASSPLEDQLRHAEREAIVRALDHARGNRTVASRILGITRRTLYNKMVEHGLGARQDDVS